MESKMNKSEKEIEAKFYLTDLNVLEHHLQTLGAQRVQERVHEINLRFDLPDGSLTQAHRVLRLRQDANAWLTYKGKAQAGESVAVRQEIEVQVSDFNTARHLLEALGYQVSVMYEKYRQTYRFEGLDITLDEMPYGLFCEIEAPDVDSIQAMAARLGLRWEARISDSYLALFDRLNANLGLNLHHLSFDEFSGLDVSPQDLGVEVGQG
jgi:adenylate cyclase, class 2